MQTINMHKSNQNNLRGRLKMMLVCYVAHTAKYLRPTYLLTLRYVLKFDNVHIIQSAKIIVGFIANVGNIFIKRLHTFFFIFFPTF